MSILFLIFLCIIQSSVKSLILESLSLQISFTYTRNSSGPKMLPCGTPDVILLSLDSCPPTLTLYVRPARNSRTQTTTLKSTPEVASFISSRSWGAKSNALEKYIIIASIPTHLSKESAMSWHTVMTWLSQEYPILNPCCPLYNQSFLSQICLKYPSIMRSSCLQTAEIKLMGL